MNRNHRLIIVLVAIIAVGIISITSIGSNLRAVSAADQKIPNQADPSTIEPIPSDVPPVDQPTDAPTEQPTDGPVDQSTDIPTEQSTIVPTDQPTDVVTDQPAEVTQSPDETVEPTTEATAEATEIAPEATETLTPEVTLEPEITETPTVALPELTVLPTCNDTGLSFEISNVGVDMEVPSHFVLTLDDIVNATAPVQPTNLAPANTPVEFILKTGEATTVEAGYGSPSMVIDGVLFTTPSPCLPPNPPVLTVSAVCTFEKGITFTIENTGGAMPTAQEFSITLSNGQVTNNNFMLASNESVSFDAGYGKPVFATQDLVSTVETACVAPVTISGTVWNDADANQLRDAAETGIPNVGITLANVNGATYQTVTLPDGSYQFAKVPSGEYTVMVDTATVSVDYVLSTPTTNPVSINAVDDLTIIDFGFAPKPSAAVTGTVWLDSANYGVRDVGELGVAGAMVELVDQSDTVVATVPVDAATGTYVFTDILAGTYTIRLKQSSLFSPNAVSWNSDSQLDYQTAITLTTGQVLKNIDFGLVGTY